MKKVLYLVIILSVNLLSQEDRDTRGKDFWLTFMPNAHITSNFQEADFLEFRDSLYIFVASDFPTNVYFEYQDRNGTVYNETIEIAEVQEYSTFQVVWSLFELRDRLGLISDGISEASFHITSDEDITVIAHNQAKWSSDGMIVYPTKTLGNRYIVNSYTPSFASSNQIRSSQFAIVATEDNTTINIDPKYQLYGTLNNLPFQIVLNEGQVYLGQASEVTDDFGRLISDLTGSEITSDKPISVFSGNERSYVPDGTRGSRDCLMAQMIPFESSGKRFHILPFEDVDNDELGNSLSPLRIVAYHDDTEVYIDGVLFGVINRGEYIDWGTSNRALFVETSKTSSVYQLRKANSDSGGDQPPIGDPFMLLNIPESQYKESYKVINFQAREFVSFGAGGIPIFRDVYEEQYISIAINRDFVNTLFFDFAPIDQNLNWAEVPGTEYVWTTLPVSIGTHSLTADTEFVCYAYGYGPANSYGFVCGGINMKLLDHNPPQVSGVERDCDTYSAIASDEQYLDSGIDRIEVTSSVNVDITFDNNGDSLNTRNYSASLIDQFNDGTAIVTSYDEFGMWVRDTILIPGFTVSLTNTSENAIIETYPNFNAGDIGNYTFELLNYGSTPININDIAIDDRLTVVSPQLPFVIPPTGTIELQIKYANQNVNEIIKDKIALIGDCFIRDIIDVDIETWLDTLKPEISSLPFEDCNPEYSRGYSIVLEDEGDFNGGMKDIEYILEDNILVNRIDELPDRIILEIKLEDPFEPGRLDLIASDLADNESEESFLIDPVSFDIEFEEETEILNLGQSLIGFSNCAEFPITNNGNFEYEINSINFEQNLSFSAPQAQFPIILQAGETKNLVVCFDDVAQSLDSLYDKAQIVIQNCLAKDLEFMGKSSDFETEGESRCKLELKFSLDGIPNKTIVESPSPNPTTGISKVFIGLKERSQVNIQVFNTFGNSFGRLISQAIEPGIFELNINTTDMESGSYFLIVNVNGEIYSKKLLVQK